jgi:chlorophyll synthase
LSSTVHPATVLTRPAPAAVLELLKPITWFPPMWAFMCGLVSSGQSASGHWLVIGLGVLLCGPLVCGTSQAVNDWFDRHVDAINEPNRPIPSGRIPGSWGFRIAVIWTLLSFVVASSLGTLVSAATLVGMVLAWAYSAPPARLKMNGWWGNAAVGACYEGLPWVTGAAVMTGGVPDWRIFAAAGLYSFGAHGIMTLNDFKSIEGDRQMGIASLPAQMGVKAASILACVVMAGPQLVMITLLAIWGHSAYAVGVAVLLLAQCALMVRLLRSPREKAIWYSGTGVTLYVLGMLVTAFALQGSGA